jgi:hypothetical protein
MGQTHEWCESGQLRTDTENIGYKDDPWVLADCVTQIFYVLNPETGNR